MPPTLPYALSPPLGNRACTVAEWTARKARSLASHCHVVQECSNLVSGEYAGNRALDCARTLGLAPLTGDPVCASPNAHAPARSELAGIILLLFAPLSLLPDRRLLFAPLPVCCWLEKMHALGWRW